MGPKACSLTHLPAVNRDPLTAPNVDRATKIGMSHEASGITVSAHVYSGKRTTLTNAQNSDFLHLNLIFDMGFGALAGVLTHLPAVNKDPLMTVSAHVYRVKLRTLTNAKHTGIVI